MSGAQGPTDFLQEIKIENSKFSRELGKDNPLAIYPPCSDRMLFGLARSEPVLTVYFLKMGECREVLGGGPAPPSKL